MWKRKITDYHLSTYGGAGDLIVCTAALRQLKLQFPERKIIIYCLLKKDVAPLLHNPNIDKLYHCYTLVGRFFLIFKVVFLRVKIVRLNYFRIPVGLCEINVKDSALDMFGISCERPKTEIYITEDEERVARESLGGHRNVVALHIHSRASINHHWPLEKWNALVKECPEFKFIQIGNIDEVAVTGVQSFLGKTTFREALALLKCCISFVGVESSFAHATNALDIQGVVLFGDTTPVNCGHDNNINIYLGVECSPCYGLLQGKMHCPYGHSCMIDISVEIVKSALRKSITSR